MNANKKKHQNPSMGNIHGFNCTCSLRKVQMDGCAVGERDVGEEGSGLSTLMAGRISNECIIWKISQLDTKLLLPAHPPGALTTGPPPFGWSSEFQ